MRDEQLLKLALEDYYLLNSEQGKRLAQMVVEREDMLTILRHDGTEAQEQAKLEERRRIAGMVREFIDHFGSTGVPYIAIPHTVIRKCEDLATAIERDLPPAQTLVSDLLKRLLDMERRVHVLKTMMDRIARGIVPAPEVSVSHYAWQALREIEEQP